MDVSREEDSQELSGTVGAGGLAAARSGLQEELDAAAEQAAVADLLQGLMNRLSPDDRHLLQLKLEGGNMSQAARELGWSRQWAAVAVDKVVQKLRQDMQQHAEQDADVAALLKSC
jgi:DNA-directed RNA polymerase specialized sigma24 family protein